MQCWARTIFYSLVAVLGISSMLGACGQKGPLYLPEPPVVDAVVSDRIPGEDVPDAMPIDDTPP
ncbi:hypothetical protein CKO25_15705 [Thiocapsa imhoffii]|uniref:Lipoprotein n=1 Tax=Thiocapsa imhoffii TaxID=382777 RepID=A0A9X0WKD2_9GAMM|nr:lipoprotein [Thiocapsa imhoffii]MBK1646065.1 hypothetical protein [Thiocapsa imhoffii]